MNLAHGIFKDPIALAIAALMVGMKAPVWLAVAALILWQGVKLTLIVILVVNAFVLFIALALIFGLFAAMAG